MTDYAPVQETAFIPLFARAAQMHWAQPILYDPWAAEAVAARLSRSAPRLSVFRIADIVCRALTIDNLAHAWQLAQSHGDVLHLGCGLDARYLRVHLPAITHWFDVDYPNILAVQEDLYPGEPCYSRVGLSVAELPEAGLATDAPVLVLAEGLLMYLEPETVAALLHWVVSHFPSGQLVFDAISPLERDAGHPEAGAVYRWALGDPLDLCRLEPKLHLVKEIPLSQWDGVERMPAWLLGISRVIDWIPALMRLHRILVYRF